MDGKSRNNEDKPPEKLAGKSRNGEDKPPEKLAGKSISGKYKHQEVMAGKSRSGKDKHPQEIAGKSRSGKDKHPEAMAEKSRKGKDKYSEEVKEGALVVLAFKEKMTKDFLQRRSRLPATVQNFVGESSNPIKKQLTASDLSNGLSLEAGDVNQYLYPLFTNAVTTGINDISVYDVQGRDYKMDFMVDVGPGDENTYMLSKNWLAFVKDHDLVMDQEITIWMFRHLQSKKPCFVITSSPVGPAGMKRKKNIAKVAPKKNNKKKNVIGFRKSSDDDDDDDDGGEGDDDEFDEDERRLPPMVPPAAWVGGRRRSNRIRM